MKILLTTRTFAPPFTGGVDVYAERLGNALAGLGHEVSFLAVDSTQEGDSGKIAVLTEEYKGYKVSRLKFALTKRPKSAFDQAYDPEMGRIVKDLFAEQKPDLLVILNFYLLTLASVEAAKSLAIPVVHIATDFVPICRRATLIRWNGESCEVGESIKSCAECFVSHRLPGKVASRVLNQSLSENTLTKLAAKRQTFPLNILRPYWEQIAIMEKRLDTIGPLREKIDLVLTPTQYTSKMFIENGFRPEQIHFMPFGIERENPLEHVTHTPSAHLRFLFVGRLQPYKGVHLLVEAFNQLENPQNATLTIYGKQDGYEEYYADFMKAVAANDRVRFAGSIPPSELGRAFGDADYFVLPSTWNENNPLILLDALQSDTPVIASDIGGVRDMVKDNVNGFLFPMGDVQALKQILQKTIDQPELIQHLKPHMNLTYIDMYAKTLLDLCAKKFGLSSSHAGAFSQ